MDKLRWGILGLGKIAKQFASGLSALDDAELVAVGSRTQENADTFGQEFDVQRCHGSYHALADDPEVDAVYVATPHSLHRENTILCLKAGKAVLCEKPFTINQGETQDMIEVARAEGRFLMEAMWTRFLPTMYKVREWLSEGRIGDVRIVTGNFGYRMGPNSKGRLFDPELGGGALLDVGVYPVSFASMVLGGPPESISSSMQFGQNGVDEQAGMLLTYEGAMALVYTDIRASTPQEAEILGTEGSIRLHPPFWRGTTATLKVGSEEETVELPYRGNGYECEAEEVKRCLDEGKLESDVMPLQESLTVMQTLDRIREQWKYRYPME